MKHPGRRAALATCMFAAVVLPAAAQDRAAAVADGLHYTLFDLTPADGTAPAVVFSTPATASLIADLTVAADAHPIQRWYDSQVVAAPAAIDQDLSYVHGGAGFLGTGSVAATGIAPQHDMAVQSYQRAGMWQEFRLAPHTSITFGMDLGLDLRLDTGSPAIHDASGSAMLWVQGADSQAEQDWLLDAVSNDPYLVRLGYGTSVQQFQAAQVTWRNDSDAWMAAQYGFDTYVIASAREGTVTPVPEPGEWAMLALGFGVLGRRLQARRQGRCARQTCGAPGGHTDASL